MMKFTLQLVIDNELGQSYIEKIIELKKNNLPSHCLGLSLLESKEILKNTQQKMLITQINEHLESQKTCSCCHQKRRIKGHETFQYHTLFGTVVLPNLRLYHCHCNKTKDKTYSALNDWLHEHNSPELQYIETKWAAHFSYQKTSELLQDLLPLHITHNAVTVKNHLHKIAKRQEVELEGKPICVSGCENEWAKLPKPNKPLIVGSDGGYVRSCYDKNKNFEVIVGKVYSETKPAKRFGLVPFNDAFYRTQAIHSRITKNRSRSW